MPTALDLHAGMIIRFNNELYSIQDYRHRTPGNKRGFVQAKMRNIKNGRFLEHKFRSNDEIEVARIDRRPAQFLYKDGSVYYFMDQESHEQFPIDAEFVNESSKFLKDGQIVDIEYFENEIVGCELGITVELTVVETVPGIKGDTATGGTKPATLETGAIINVPLFINEGDIIRVDTRTGEYIERVK